MRLLFLISLLTLSGIVFAQPKLELSEKHNARINEQVDAMRKRTLYLKYFKKDSLRFARETKKYWKAKWDSAHGKFESKKQHVLEAKQNLNSSITEGINNLQPVIIPQSLYRMPPEVAARFTPVYLETTYSLAREFLSKAISDTTDAFINFRQPLEAISKVEGIEIPALNSSNLLKQLPTNDFRKFGQSLKDKVKDHEAFDKFESAQGKIGEYSDDISKVQGYLNMTPDSLATLATARIEKEAQSRLMSLAGAQSYQTQLNDFNKLTNQYKNQLSQLNDTTARKEFLKQQAEKLAMNYINDNPELLKGLQTKLNLLMKKYSSVANSNDLSSAVKRTSLQGHTFRERLVIAANFQLLSIDPFSIDFSPQLGYRFDSRFSLGIGGTYRQTFTNTNISIAPDVLGYKGFLSYDIVKSFFAYGEYAQNSPGIDATTENQVRIWQPAAMLGIGKRFSLYKKVDMTVTALYNFMHDPEDTIYPRPFIIRFGFQLSETALMKVKPPVKNF